MSAPARFAIALSAALMPIAPGIAEERPPTALFAQGIAAGTTRDGVVRYLGLPYAAPPIGTLRWNAPRPPARWPGVRAATAFAPACRQTVDWITERQSEDCLYLNIWAPAGTRPGTLPVIVWIHGGGYFGGSGAQPGYEGTRLARRGAIVVTLNYRLGIFGFFAHPELSRRDHVTGNQGVLDQIAALRWVARNIAAVGGDPRRVTIMGESAGGESVAVLTASPRAAGLFHRAISQSGNWGIPLTPDEAPDYAADAARATGAALGHTLDRPTLAALRATPAVDLLRQPWLPRTVLDGDLVRQDMTSAYRQGRYNRVPLLVGWNSNEGVDLAVELYGTDDLTIANHASLLAKLLRRPPSPAILRAYPASTDAQARDSLHRFATDWWGWRMRTWADLHRPAGGGASGSPAWLYYFIHWPAEPASPCNYGCKAGHGAEIPFVFDQLDQDARAWRRDDRDLADRMATYWVNFARTGNPNGPTLPVWPAFDGTERTVHRFGTPEEVALRKSLPAFDLFDR